MAEGKSFDVQKAGSRCLERPLYKHLKNLLGQQHQAHLGTARIAHYWGLPIIDTPFSFDQPVHF